MTHKTFLLLILDGFGISPPSEFNAITHAKTPTWDYLWENYPHTLLDASGLSVGLPDQQIGNSEVGHTTIGAGRTVYQDLTRIDQAIRDRTFQTNPIVQQAIQLGKNRAVHLMGLLSPGGVHSHENHFFETIKLFAETGCTNIFVHAFLDGRDIPPKTAQASLVRLQEICQRYPQVKPASVMGRYYAMDRDQRWDRTQLAYDALTLAQTDHFADTPLEALTQAYTRGETDEFVKPTWIKNAPPIQDDDVVFFINFRSDRARQLSRAFLQKDFSGFTRTKTLKLAEFISLTEYANDIPSTVIFPPQNLANTLGQYLAALGKTQLRIAETEKYAHVTFFFNGGQETPFAREERILIPSLKIATYDLQPEMSARAVTENLTAAIRGGKFDCIVCNLANPDMIGHTGNFAATVKAIEVIDECLTEICAALKDCNGEMLLSADHGNADCMFDEHSHQPHTAHTTSLVPLVYMGHPAKVLHSQGTLADIAPTLLSLMGLPVPKEMTGKVMFDK